MEIGKNLLSYMKGYFLFVILLFVSCADEVIDNTLDNILETTPVLQITSPTNGQKGTTTFTVEGTVHDTSQIRGVFVFSTSLTGTEGTNITALTLTGGELSTFEGNISFIKSGWNYVWVTTINEWNKSTNSSLILVEAQHGYVSTNTNVVEVDTTPPVVVIDTPTPNQQVGGSYSFTGTVADVDSQVNSVWVKIDNNSYTEANLGYGKWSEIFNVEPGVHTNYVYAIDTEGNQSVPLTNICEYQAGMPFVEISYPLSGNLTRLTTTSVYGMSSVDGGFISSVDIKVNDGVYSAVTGISNWSKEITLSEGTNIITARAIASTGSTNYSASVSVVLDGTAPITIITTPTNNSILTNQSFTIRGTANDAFSGMESVFVAVNDDGFNPVSGTTTWSKSVALSPGNHVIKSYSRDVAGNFSATNQVSITIQQIQTNEESFKIYCMEQPTWTGVRVHFWGGSCGQSDWPGEVMIDEGSGWYSYTFADGSNTSLLFNNAGAGLNPDGGDKTSDLTRAVTGWYWTNGQWYDENPVGPQPPTVSASPSGGTFYSDTYSVTLNVSGDNVTASKYSINGSNPANGTSYSDGEQINISTGMNIGDVRTLKLYALNDIGSNVASYTFTKVEEPQPVTNGGFNSLRIYQVMVESFIDGDTSRDFGTGYGPSHHNGDLQGIINALPYIESMGFNAIWLTPIFNSDGGSQLDATGYFTRYYFQIDPHFGTWEKAQELVDTAHDLGMYVFFDGVFGHHKGGIPSSPSGYYPDGGNDPVSYPGSLNFYREVATFWIKELKIDGWRLDQAYQVPVSAWTELRTVVENQSQSNLMAGNTWGTLGYMVGEIWNGESVIQNTGYGPESSPALYSCFDFPLRYRLVQVLAQEESGLGGQPASKLQEGYTSHDTYASHAIPNLMLGNHDLVRFGDLIQRYYGYATENDDYWKRHKAAFSFLASYTGPITFYYGEELGHEVWDDQNYYDDNVARSSGQIDNLTAKQSDLTNYVTTLMELRETYSALWDGDRQNIMATTTIYADLKTSGTEKIVYILNTSTSSETVTINDSAVGGNGLLDLITGESISGSGSYSVTVDGLTGRFLLVQ